MLLRKTAAGLAATAALFMAAPAASAIAAPSNWPAGTGANPTFVQNQSTGLYWHINSAGVLTADGLNNRTFFTAAYFHSNTWGDAAEIIEVGGPLPGHCLTWDNNAGVYDVRKNVACNSSFSTGTWDLFQAGSTAQFSELWTLWERINTGGCMWEFSGITSSGCNGMNTLDKWFFQYKYLT